MRAHIIRWPLYLLALTLHLSVSAQQTSEYEKLTEQWHAGRIRELKADNGWLNLAGLLWLEEGPNSFGSGSLNKLVFPSGKIPLKAGVLERRGDAVTMTAASKVKILVDGKPARNAVVLHPDSSVAPMMAYGDLRWNIIKRQDKLGVRLRDLQHPNLMDFKGVERFPVDTFWRKEAVLITEMYTRKIAVTNMLGQTNMLSSPGKLRFRIDGRYHTLDALEEGDELFIIFGDETSGVETYSSGRFIYAKKPGADGRTILDFNRAINPPCAFTTFATCPIPPKQNILPMAVRAGEKNYHHD